MAAQGLSWAEAKQSWAVASLKRTHPAIERQVRSRLDGLKMAQSSKVFLERRFMQAAQPKTYTRYFPERRSPSFEQGLITSHPKTVVYHLWPLRREKVLWHRFRLRSDCFRKQSSSWEGAHSVEDGCLVPWKVQSSGEREKCWIFSWCEACLSMYL